MSRELLRRAFLVIPLVLAILAGCTDKETTAPLLGTDARLAQGDGGVWTVNSLSDPGVGVCDDTECTLREAIAAAASGDQVVFASGLQGAIALATGEMVINKPLSVNGDGRITIDAQTISRVLNVSNGAVTLSGLTLTGGRRIGENGGGILVTAANLTLDGMTLLVNESGFQGGGVYADATATVTIRNSTFRHNVASGGGAIANHGSLTLERSTLTLNEALSGGSQLANYGNLTMDGTTVGGSFHTGIINQAGATATIVRSTIYGNAATSQPGLGAGIHNLGVMQLRSSTVAENISPIGVGGIYNGGSLTVVNSIVASNNGNPECGGPNAVTSLGFNLTTTGGGCAFTAASDVEVPLAQVYTNLFEVGLQDNGGPTQTIALAPGGFAEDAGSCAGETTDQRGFVRPVDNPFYPNAADGCDIGAFEVQLTPAQKVTAVANVVSSLSLAKGTTTSLQTKLTSALTAIEAGDIASACSSLTAFVNEVNAQAGKKKISASDAANLVAMANDLKTALGCP